MADAKIHFNAIILLLVLALDPVPNSLLSINFGLPHSSNLHKQS
jgi:hypothetical protein